MKTKIMNKLASMMLNIETAINNTKMGKILIGLFVVSLLVLYGSFDDIDEYGNLMEGNGVPCGIPVSMMLACTLGLDSIGSTLNKEE